MADFFPMGKRELEIEVRPHQGHEGPRRLVVRSNGLDLTPMAQKSLRPAYCPVKALGAIEFE